MCLRHRGGATSPIALASVGGTSFILGVTLTSVKTALADIWTQHAIESRPWSSLDRRRVGIFAAFGLLYLGGVQHVLFVYLYPWLFPSAARFAALPFAAKLADRAGQRAVVGQVAIDQGIHWPLLAIPAFHVFKGFGERRSVLSSLRSCREAWLSDVMACWAVWIPAQTLNFAFMPMWLRVPFAAVVSFGYTAFVSSRRGAPLSEEAEGGGVCGVHEDAI